MDSVFLSEIELFQSLPHPSGGVGDVELCNVDITVKELALIERTFLSQHLCLDFTAAKVEDKKTLKGDTAFLYPA